MWSLSGYLYAHFQGTCVVTARVLVWSLPGYMCGHCQGTCVVTARVLVVLSGYFTSNGTDINVILKFTRDTVPNVESLNDWVLNPGRWHAIHSSHLTPRLLEE